MEGGGVDSALTDRTSLPTCRTDGWWTGYWSGWLRFKMDASVFLDFLVKSGQWCCIPLSWKGTTARVRLMAQYAKLS